MSQASTPQQIRNNPAVVNDQQKRKKRDQQYKKQALQNKNKWMPFVKYLKKNGLKIKTARCSKFRIEYFRTDDVENILSKHRQEIQKDSKLKQYKYTWEKQVIYFVRPQNLPSLKYPKQLEKSQANAKSKFATFKFDLSEPKTWMFPAILLTIIAVVLFPLWPYYLKYAIFIICLYLVILIVSVIILRLVLYMLGAMLGVSFWLFPGFFSEQQVLKSFIPVISVNKWQSGFFSIIGRLIAFFILGYYTYHVYTDSSWVFENIEITKTSFDDLHDWGVSKIKGQKNFSQSALTNLKDIMNQTADIHVDQSINLGNQEFQMSNHQQENEQQFQKNRQQDQSEQQNSQF